LGAPAAVEMNAEYRATPPIQRYVILEQTQVAAMVVGARAMTWISKIVARRRGAAPSGDRHRDFRWRRFTSLSN
jgi:hypothetical protein